MRLFWAIELPEDVLGRLLAVQGELRGACPEAGVRWSRPEQLHLTVQFLGEAEAAGQILEAVAKLDPPGALELALTGLGTFGGRRPRVVWAGVGGPGREALVDLARRLAAAHAPLGFEPDRRPYRPHVTLARVRPPRRRSDGAGRELAQAVGAVGFEPLPFTASELVLLKSSAGAGHGPARYTPTGRWSLRVSP